MRNIFIFLMLFISSQSSFSQEIEVDSLLTLISQAKEDTNKVNLLIAVGGIIENNNPVAASGYYRQAEIISRKNSFLSGQYQAIVGLGDTKNMQGDYDSSYYFMKEALDIAIRMKSEIKIGISNLNIGINYRDKGDFESALRYFIEGRRIIEKSKDKQLMAKLYDAMQVLYNYRTEYVKGIEYGEKALPEARILNDTMLLAKCLVNLALNYNSIGRIKEAELLLLEAFGIANKKNDKRIESAVIMNLADLALKKKDALLIKKYSFKALELSKEMNSISDKALALRTIGTAYLIEKRMDSANYYAIEAFKIDTAHLLRQETVQTLSLLANISFASGAINEGLDFDLQVNDTLSAFINEIISKESAELEKKFETEKKDNQIKLQQVEIQRKRTFNYILTGSVIALIIISLLGYRNYRHKQKLQQQRISELETQQQLTATEAVLKGEEQERTRLAKDLHDGLGGMLSGIKYSFSTMKGNLVMTPENAQAFERSMDMLDSSIKEMRRVAHNMMPEALVKFGLDIALKDFCNEINQTGAIKVNYQSIGLENVEIDKTISITVYRIVQELINNTMKHSGAKNAIVQIAKSDEHLSVTVEDDGMGFDTSILNSSHGIGWTNIQNRVEFLKGKLDVNSTKDKGTSVFIELTV